MSRASTISAYAVRTDDVGMDARTTYCYLLAIEDQRDETTWGVHLLDLADQGLHPDYTIALAVRLQL